MNIVFNVNELGMEGLGATLSSLVSNCSDNSQLVLWFLCSELRLRDKDNIRSLLSSVGYRGDVKFVDFDAKGEFGHLRSLHGDWTPYGRLLIPRTIPDKKALYLDSDLLVLLDILTLKDYEMGDSLLGAVFGCDLKYALDNSFFTQNLSWSLDTPYFNSGVVLFNLEKWRQDDVDSQWLKLAERYPDGLISHDQTLLNAVAGGKFARLPDAYNNPWYPGEGELLSYHNSIVHFVGSPKPWDLSGRFLHGGYKIWRSYNTGFWQKEYLKMTAGKLRRTWNIRKSIVRTLKIHMNQK